MDKLFEILLEGLEENAGLDEKRKLVNSMLPVHKYTLMQRFLWEYSWLSEENRLKCLPIFLDERTKYFDFVQISSNQNTIRHILEIIPRNCPNIETIDLRGLLITPEIKEFFKTFLKQTTSLKSLRVDCANYKTNCEIYHLLLENDFDLLDDDVKTGLLKIEHINGNGFSAAQCARLLKILPNLKSLGRLQSLDPLLTSYSNNDDILSKLSKITEFFLHNTNLTALEHFVKYCYNVKMLSLWFPGKKVIENLWKFPLLTKIKVSADDPEFVSELINLLKKNGKQITYLNLDISNKMRIDYNVLHELCPKLVYLTIMNSIIAD